LYPLQCLNFPSQVYLILEGFVPTNLEASLID